MPLPAITPLTRVRGDNCVLPLKLVHPDTGAPFNPTNYVLMFTVKLRHHDPDTAAQIQKLSTAGGIAVVGATAGEVTVSLVPADSKNLSANVSYYCDVRAQHENGTRLTVFRGTLTFEPDISREAELSIDTIVITPDAAYLSAEQIEANRAASESAKQAAQEAQEAAAAAAQQASGAVSAHAARNDNPHNVTKAQVGLGNVDNTSDAGKPISTATRTALDAIPKHGAYQNLRSILRRGRSASWLLAADSTSNASDEWAYRFMQAVAAQNPALNVVSQEWSIATQSYGHPVVVQTGSGGQEYMQFTTPPGGTTTPPSIGPTAAITGDFGAAVQITADDWTPSALQLLLRLGNAGDNNVFWLAINTSGTLRCTYNTNAGANADDQTATSSVALSGVTDGVTKLWVGFTYDRDNGAGGSDFKFYTSTDGVTWTQLGTTVTKSSNNLIRTNGAANSWWLGGTGASFPFVGKVFAVRVLAGSPSLTTGVYQIPEEIGAWSIGHETYQSFVGQTLWFYNASLSGQTLDYHTETAARTASICLNPRTPFVLFSSMHNYGSNVGATYRGLLDTAMTAFATALPNATFAGSTQNPQIAPRTLQNQLNQDQRARDFVQWCRKNGIGCINGYEAFVGSNLALDTLIGADGVHPNTTGSDLWRDAALAEWIGS